MKETYLYFGLLVAIAAIFFVYNNRVHEGFLIPINSRGTWSASTGDGYTLNGEKTAYQFPDSNTIVLKRPGTKLFGPVDSGTDECIPSVGSDIIYDGTFALPANKQFDLNDTTTATFFRARLPVNTKVTHVNLTHPHGIALTLSKPHPFPITPAGKDNINLGYILVFDFTKCNSTNISTIPSVRESPIPVSEELLDELRYITKAGETHLGTFILNCNGLCSDGSICGLNLDTLTIDTVHFPTVSLSTVDMMGNNTAMLIQTLNKLALNNTVRIYLRSRAMAITIASFDYVSSTVDTPKQLIHLTYKNYTQDQEYFEMLGSYIQENTSLWICPAIYFLYSLSPLDNSNKPSSKNPPLNNAPLNNAPLINDPYLNNDPSSIGRYDDWHNTDTIWASTKEYLTNMSSPTPTTNYIFRLPHLRY